MRRGEQSSTNACTSKLSFFWGCTSKLSFFWPSLGWSGDGSLTFGRTMPRYAGRHGEDAEFLALSDGLNERALRAAAARASQQPDNDEGSVEDVEVGGVVFHVQASGGHDAGDAAAADMPMPGEEDPFAFPDDDLAARLDEAHVDGEMARDEDEREHRAAEGAVEEEVEQAVVLPARAIAPAPRHSNRRVHFARGKEVPRRRRKVLR